MRVLTLYSHGEHLHDRIMLIRGVYWTYKTDLTPITLYWNVRTKQGMWAVMYMCQAYRSYLFTMCILGFGSVPTVWYFCVLRNLCNSNTHVSVEFASYSFCGSWIMLLWFVECNTGYYGPRCLTKCGKCEGNNCSRLNGSCTNCLPGWKGRRCDNRKLVVYRASCTLSIVYS